MKEFSVVCSIKCFPSDNVLESGKLKDRLALKKEIQTLAFMAANEWMKLHNIKRWLLTAERPFLTAPCVLTLTVHYADNRRRGITKARTRTSTWKRAII